MKVTILGCGPSYGVPSLYKGWGNCDPHNPKNNRLRSALFIEKQGKNILIDTPPEIRLELLEAHIKKIDALLYTHFHYDHIAGAEDVYNFKKKCGETLEVFGTKQDLKALQKNLDFVFKSSENASILALNPIKMYDTFTVKGISVCPIKQFHGTISSVGYRIGNFAYSTDVKSMDPKGWDLLKGIEVWILGCVTDKINNKHVCLDEAMEWIQKIKPKYAYLTHMGTELDYETLCQKLPKNIRPAYDGLQIEINIDKK